MNFSIAPLFVFHSLRPVPWRDGIDYVEYSQNAHRTLNDTQSVGIEIEFSLFDATTGAPVDRSVYANSTTLNQQEDFISDLHEQLTVQDIDVEQIHAESGPGQMEVVLKHLPDAIAVVDNVVLARETIQQVARAHGMRSVFLPKCNVAYAGNGLHMHLSFSEIVARGKTDSMSADGSVAGTEISGMSAEENYFAREGQSFVEGILQHLPALLAITIPSVNSFRRVGKGCWTGHELGWAVEDKEAPLRLCRDVTTGESSQLLGVSEIHDLPTDGIDCLVGFARSCA